MGLLVVGCATHELVLMVHPYTREVLKCESEGMGILPFILAKQKVNQCVQQLQNIGYVKSDELQRFETAEADLRRYWQEELRPAVVRGELTTVEAIRRLNERETQYFKPTTVPERLQQYRLALARLVDQRELTLEDAERYETEARTTGKFLPIRPERPSEERKKLYQPM